MLNEWASDLEFVAVCTFIIHDYNVQYVLVGLNIVPANILHAFFSPQPMLWTAITHDTNRQHWNPKQMIYYIYTWSFSFILHEMGFVRRKKLQKCSDDSWSEHVRQVNQQVLTFPDDCVSCKTIIIIRTGVKNELWGDRYFTKILSPPAISFLI